MSMPDECKWCGCSKVLSATIESLYFGCLTRYCSYDGEWYISDTCAHTLVHTAHTLRMVAEARKVPEITEEPEDIEDQASEPQERPTIANSVRRMPDLRERIAKAVEAIKTVARYKIEAVYDFGAIGKPDKIGDWVHFEDLEPVIEILTGSYPEIPDDSLNSPEKQEGSP